MNKEVEIAKKQGLNWQALLLEQAQTDIKLVIKQAITSNIGFNNIKRQVHKIILNAVKDLSSNELKQIARQSLQSFAETLYRQCLITLGIPIPSIFMAYGYLNQNMNIPSVVKQYKSTYIEIGQPTGKYMKDYMDNVKKVLNDIVNSQAKYDKHISLRNIAEMTVRYEAATKNIEELKAKGINLVQSSRHANCSKRCEPWQGGYYTLDNTYQVVDGIQFQPLKNATDIYYTTKAGKTYKNGHITGYNCRHKLFPYKKGYSQPMVSAEVIEKQRAIDQRMRKYERDVRYYREKALMYKGQDQKKYVQAKSKAATLYQQYKDYAKENSRAYYPSRVEVL